MIRNRYLKKYINNTIGIENVYFMWQKGNLMGMKINDGVIKLKYVFEIKGTNVTWEILYEHEI